MGSNNNFNRRFDLANIILDPPPLVHRLCMCHIDWWNRQNAIGNQITI